METGAITRTTNVTLEGRGTLTLRPSDHMATGGEGSIYRANDTVVKLYKDQNRMTREGLEDKIKLLRTILHPYIVAPSGLVYGARRKLIGFYMPRATGTPLPQVFTGAYRKRSGFTDADAVMLTDRMRDAIQVAHDHRALTVDANELNYLVSGADPHRPEPRLIDVDSWAIGSWPAQVIMPSIRDYHTATFSELTDWFAWGVVTFQVFSGIHPYKGTLDGYDRFDLERRMRENASVFRKGVKLNAQVRDFGTIPGPLLTWYIETFEHGRREVPPSPTATGAIPGSVPKVYRRVTTTTGSLVYRKVLGADGDDVIRLFPSGVALRKSGTLVDLVSKRSIGRFDGDELEVVGVTGGWLVAVRSGTAFAFTFVSGDSFTHTTLPSETQGAALVRFEDRLFVHTLRGLSEIIVPELSKKMISLGHTWSVLPFAMTWFAGIGVQDVMGARYVVAPFGDVGCTVMRIPELDGYHVVSGKAGERYAVLVGADGQGTYYRIELLFDAGYTGCTVHFTKTDTPALNVTILPKGVVASLIDDGELILTVPRQGSEHRVTDSKLSTDMELSRTDNTVYVLTGGELWSMRMT